MTVSITAVTRKQWQKVATVALWVVLTNGIGILTAYLTAKPELLAIGPALNVAGKAVQQIFQTEEDQAFGQLPAQVIPPSLDIVSTPQPDGSVQTAPVAAPIVAAPLNFKPEDKATPNIGSTANS